jgi:hypothetical protein
MKRLALFSALGLALAATPSALLASSDSDCGPPDWKLHSATYTCAGLVMLAPGNDTRINLLLLMRDRGGVPAPAPPHPPANRNSRAHGHSFFDWQFLRDTYYPSPHSNAAVTDTEYSDANFSGSRCASLKAGAIGFQTALASSRAIPPGERGQLLSARRQLDWSCRYGGVGTAQGAVQPGVPPRPPWPNGPLSAAGNEFLAYLRAADAFYDGRWERGRARFAELRSAQNPWVAETALYMLGRLELNAAQDKAFDDYGWYGGPETIDQSAVVRARSAIDTYLGKYPTGQYSVSARGLVRRTMWLAGNEKGLAGEYERLLATVSPDTAGAADLAEEIDRKLLMSDSADAAIDTPLLLAIHDLAMMRTLPTTDEAESGTPAQAVALTAAALAKQAPTFAKYPELYAFLRATHAFYVAGDMRQVTTLIPDDTHRKHYTALAFSGQVLRAMALAALGDPDETRVWLTLLDGAEPLYQRPLVELGLALNYERTERLAAVFATGSPVRNPTIREILLQHSAGPDLLRARARDASLPRRERDIALFALLHKELSRGWYAAFAQDLQLVPANANTDAGLSDFQSQDEIPVGLFMAGRWSDGYPCPRIKETAATLARDPRDTRARLCVGDFHRLNGFDGFDQLDTSPEKERLGGAASEFPGARLDRGTFYADVINDARTQPVDRAYALYRAIRCYAPTGDNGCGGTEVDIAQRRAWFQRLKRDFPESPWAKKLQFYW